MLLVLPHRQVVAVETPVLLAREPGRECAAVTALDEPLQQERHPGAGGVAPHPRVFVEDRLGGIPETLLHDGWVLPRIPLVAMPDLAQVHPVAQDLVDEALVDGFSLPHPALLRGPGLGGHPVEAELLDQPGRGAEFDETLEDMPDGLRLLRVGDQPPVLDVVAERRDTAHPQPLALAGRNLVADALAGHLALELGEGEQDVQHQPPHGGGGVELLGDRDEGHPVALEHLDHAREVGERAGEAVDLVDHHGIDLARLDVGEQALQGGTLHGAARVGGVVVVIGDGDPALGALARDIGMPRIALGVDGVVLLVEALLGGLAGVDGAAQAPGEVRAHGRPPRCFCRLRLRRPLEAEEERPRPARAGDLAGDHGEAGIRAGPGRRTARPA